MHKEPRRELEQHAERMDRIEVDIEKVAVNNRETSEIVIQVAAAQKRNEELLSTLLDALVTGRGNGHSQKPLPPE